MAIIASDDSDDKLSLLWHSACSDYAKETGITLTDDEFPKINGPEDLSRQLESEEDNFEDFRMKRRPLLHAMQMVLAPFEAWGDLIAGVAAAAFPPASSIMGAMLLLVRGARKVSEAFNSITDLFHKLGNFALRLDSYKGVPLSEGMKTIIVNVLVNFLRVCAASQKCLSHGSLRTRLSKWAKNIIVEDTSINSLLSELEELTSQEHLMVSAHGLNLTHQALRNTEELLERDGRKNDRDRLERVKKSLDPVSASGQVFSSTNANRIPGSGSWIEDRIRTWWQGSQPILWLHGGPGVGKSHLASKIITDLSKPESSASPPPMVASFFCKNNDVDLRSLNKALRTLAWQIATQQPSFAAHAEEFSLKEDLENSYIVWRKLLVEYFAGAPLNAVACLVIDGIDEAEPGEQEILFSLLERTFEEEGDVNQRPPLRVVLLSRDSVRPMIDEHSLSWIPEIEVGNEQNKDDLHHYVSQKLQKTQLFRNSPDFQEEIISEISREAEGLWEWANFVVKSVVRCRTKEQIRKAVKAMPRGISAMLRQELQRLSRELSVSDVSDDEGSAGETTAAQIEQLNILLSFVTLAVKPLTVCQLDVMLEIVLKEEVLNLEDDIRTIYSSLFSTRPNETPASYDKSDFVTLRHSSFYEFFRTSEETGPIYVNAHRTEARFVYVCLRAVKEYDTPPTSDRSTQDVWQYATDFLPSHLMCAHFQEPGNLGREISDLFADLFTQEPYMMWLIEVTSQQLHREYYFFPRAQISKLGRYWMDSDTPSVANKKAQLVLDWILPETLQIFLNHARSSDLASDACPFTVLFSHMVVFWSRLWLDPEDIKEDDGSPEIIPYLLAAYHTLATGNTEFDADVLMPSESIYSSPVILLRAAELQSRQKTPMWHARVAQALRSRFCYQDALDHFQIFLDEHQKYPGLSTMSLFVIHRDMARTLKELGRHKKALSHFELSNSLRKDFLGDKKLEDSEYIANLLSAAQMKHLARLPDDALATVEEAWQFVLRNDDEWFRPDLMSFFIIFLELHQPHRIRSVLDFAFTHLQVPPGKQSLYHDFPLFILESLSFRPRVMYRILHHAVTPDDQRYLDIISWIVGKIDTETTEWSVVGSFGIIGKIDILTWELNNLAEVGYFLATLLLEKGQVSQGIQGLYEVAALSKSLNDWDIKPARNRSICDLAALCLSDADIPFVERSPLVLDKDAEYSDVCLVISSWLHDHGDLINSRNALRGRVRQGVSRLSGYDPSNDIGGFVRLFRTFLTATDSDADLGAALHLIKLYDDRELGVYNKGQFLLNMLHDDTQGDLSESLDRVRVADARARDEDAGVYTSVDSVWGVENRFSNDPMTECSSCRCEIETIHWWYFCRSCPNKGLCRRCYRQLQPPVLANPDDTPPSASDKMPPGVCGPQHKFYYTGLLGRPDEHVPTNMVPLVSTTGETQEIWIEEWKDRLEEEWETADFEFEGGLSAWCSRVLPEPQRTRWATFFGA
ncbi:hypothetical protein V500_07098 [Pseudogymnoascus sp. VKM F-4518 (FW-2643)]|nr:hypothetical protein V500_07098 [Pseudogymnoascus sp. VKM F-4518 (FW-2643)]